MKVLHYALGKIHLFIPLARNQTLKSNQIQPESTRGQSGRQGGLSGASHFGKHMHCWSVFEPDTESLAAPVALLYCWPWPMNSLEKDKCREKISTGKMKYTIVIEATWCNSLPRNQRMHDSRCTWPQWLVSHLSLIVMSCLPSAAPGLKLKWHLSVKAPREPRKAGRRTDSVVLIEATDAKSVYEQLIPLLNVPYDCMN